MTDSQLSEICSELKKLGPVDFRVALFHHHPIPHEALGLGSEDLMKNGSQLMQILEEYEFHIAIHGHKHFPRLCYSQGGSNSCAILAAGSLSAVSPKMLSVTRNLFHIITLDAQSVKNCTRQGSVDSWEFHFGEGWSEPNQQSANFESISGFGFCGDVAKLADKTVEFIDNSTDPYIEWDDLMQGIPQIRYLLPSDLKKFVARLQEQNILVQYPFSVARKS